MVVKFGVLQQKLHENIHLIDFREKKLVIKRHEIFGGLTDPSSLPCHTSHFFAYPLPPKRVTYP